MMFPDISLVAVSATAADSVASETSRTSHGPGSATHQNPVTTHTS